MTLAKKISAVVTQFLPTIVNGIQVKNLLTNLNSEPASSSRC